MTDGQNSGSTAFVEVSAFGHDPEAFFGYPTKLDETFLTSATSSSAKRAPQAPQGVMKNQSQSNGRRPAQVEDHFNSFAEQVNARLFNLETALMASGILSAAGSWDSQAMAQAHVPAAAAQAQGARYSIYAQDGDAPTMRDLDRLIHIEFSQQPKPNVGDLNRIYHILEPYFPNAGRRKVISAVRKWYRKRRDENGQKVFAACETHILPLINGGVPAEEVKDKFDNKKGDLFTRLMEASSLDLVDGDIKDQFFIEKVHAYFTRRITGGKQ